MCINEDNQPGKSETMKVLKTIYSYPGLLPFEPNEENANRMMASLAEAGVTHVQINHLPDMMHPEQLAQPDNVYLAFANFGPPLDLYVSSRINYGLWPEMYLDRNQACLKRFAAAARKHGIKPILYLCEPRFVPERFFQKNPTLRGPRVDNPTCSTTPLFALCTDMPEVKEHYRSGESGANSGIGLFYSFRKGRAKPGLCVK